MEKMILGNRYELQEKIGGGGMATVYKARCLLLNRNVAVKILRPEFISDEEFVKRFRIEAQSAASLSHPNIVSIYDVGQEDGIQYIIMEYIDGITLKEYIDEKGKLEWDEAVNITIQICSAIEHAHRNHIVHRDIKPHNILLTRDGIAKVTDFGIARAVTSSTITIVGSTIGSVHYFSPEQARGGFTDEKSDLYSIGVTLYEMLTGHVPFDGETPVAIALKHIQENAVPPKLLEADIPAGLNLIVMKAIKKDQSRRYQSAQEMQDDLYRVLKEPGMTIAEEEGSDENTPTRRMKALGASKKSREEYLIKNAGDDEVKKKKNDKKTVILAVATAVVLMAIFVYIGYKLVNPAIPGSKDSIVLDNFVGSSYDEIKSKLDELADNGIKVDLKRKFSDTVTKDIVISQEPDADTEMKTGSGGYNTVTIVLSDGVEMKEVPDLKNMEYREAQNELQKDGFEPKTAEENNDVIATGSVIRTDPEGKTMAEAGSVVTIYKSLGPEIKKTIVPSLTGLKKEEAQTKLEEANLVMGNVSPENSSNYIDIVKKQVPIAGTQVDEGSAVDIYLSETNGSDLKKRTYVSLTAPDKYGDKVTVRIDIIRSDDNKLDRLIPGMERDKSEFPIPVDIPIPAGGNTKVAIYLDGILDQQFTIDSSEVR